MLPVAVGVVTHVNDINMASTYCVWVLGIVSLDQEGSEGKAAAALFSLDLPALTVYLLVFLADRGPSLVQLRLSRQ